MKITRKSIALFIIAVSFLGEATSRAGEWQQVKDGKRGGISGLAAIKADSSGGLFLMVHDNKKPQDRKIAVIKVREKKRPLYFPVAWPKDVASPVDLESLTSVSGKQKGTFLTATSKGHVFHIQLGAGNTKVKVLKQFKLPNRDGKNFEGLGLYEKNGSYVAVWAHRGGKGSPGTVFWSSFDLSTYQFSRVWSVSILVPWPTGNNVRSISDLTIDANGVVYISAASDPGDNGPFDSALYRIGKIVTEGKEASLKLLAEPEEIHRLPGYKVEGLVLFPGKTPAFLVGTDDENKGSSVRLLN